jgi:integrase
MLAIRSAEKHAYERAKESLRPLGIPLDLVAHQFVEATKILQGFSLIEAARYFIQRQSVKFTPKPVPEIVAELVENRKRTGRSKPYLRDLRTRLGRFGKKFSCPLSSVSHLEIEGYLHGLNGGARYKNNVLQAIGTLFGYAKKRAYVPRDSEGISGVTRYDVKGKEIEVFTPEELSEMLRVANPQVQLALALTCFAGIRGAELGRLDWKDFKFEAGFIRVRAASAKTGIRRVPPIPPNLRLWLLLHKKESGPVVAYKNIYNQYAKVAHKAKIKWKRNAHRHGFASYRTALTKNLQQVAIEAGNSKQMLLTNYFQLVSEQEARAWFSIVPPATPQPDLESDTAPAQINAAAA